MTLRTKTLTAALALTISAAGVALAQDAATPAPVPAAPAQEAAQEPAGTPQSSGPAVTLSPATPAPATQADAPAVPAEGAADQPTPAPTQSSEPVSVPSPADQTPMEAPSAPTVAPVENATEPAAAEAPATADLSAEDVPAAEAPAAETPADGAEAPETVEPTAEPATGEAAPDDTADVAEPEDAGQPAGDAVLVTEGEEAAVPAETTGQVVAVEGHDDIEGASAEGEEDHGGGDHGAAHIEDIAFSFEGPFGKYDQFQLQRGLQVYTEVCAGCHGMKFVPLRTLHDEGGPGLPEDQVRAYAANLAPILDPETGEERPRLPTDHFPTVAGEGMGPDLSLMAKARAGFHGPQGLGINQFLYGIGGPEYIHAILTDYTGEEVEQAGSVLYENTAFPGGLISMPPPLSDDLITYEDGTPATADQMARDVAAFMMWTAEPKMASRKQVGLVSVLFLIVLTSLLYLSNKRLWKPHKGKPLHR